ncbi:MAG: branched-chain amino acid ABC transporter permease [Alphaproteobacteria bacterium]|nr:branched-chain amino acid ABC transporter permease [Alphaproteobacteria bacterium]MDE2513075.1 branched-chain amino acid ABC transporter permease [Alphaproteobacteria bacterium]
MIVLQLVVNGVLLGGTYILLAQGLNLVFGVMGIVNLAHGSIITVAGLFTYWFVTHTDQSPLWLIPCVFVVMLAVGAVLQRLLLEPLAKLGTRRELLSLMVTFGLSYVIVETALNFFGSQYVSLPNLQETWSIGGLAINEALVAAGVLGALISGCLHVWLHYTPSGKALLATSQNATGAVTCGIDVRRMRGISFAIGSALAGIAGVLLILILPLSAPTADTLTILSFVIVALGGLGDYKGAVYAGLLLGLVQSGVGYYLGGDVEVVVPYLLLITFMVLRPQGLGQAAR